ncbi:MAG: hypothetical protein Kow0098_14060 [Ignavibacteriaceae bacterium]
MLGNIKKYETDCIKLGLRSECLISYRYRIARNMKIEPTKGVTIADQSADRKFILSKNIIVAAARKSVSFR